MSDPIRPHYIAGTYGEILSDFRANIKLSASEMDDIISNHGFTRESLEETHRLFKLLWNYQARSSMPLQRSDETQDPNQKVRE